jgi:serine/threonine-protein kinase
VEIVDFLEEGPGRVACVMEPLFGETVKDRAKRAPMKVSTVVKIMRQACSALGAVHLAGIVHRDLKPDNLFLVERDGVTDFLKVLDFGIAQILDDEQGLLTTRAGEVVGTPAYMAPEQTISGQIDGRAESVVMLAAVATLTLWRLLARGEQQTGEAPLLSRS